MLLNILPDEIAEELKQFGRSYTRKHQQVSVLFADIKDLRLIAEKLTPEKLVTQLDEVSAHSTILLRNTISKK
ncbi:MAG: adenylate/guanylate cyclase domain-containing protein [Bacteroidota bacterium]